MDLFSSKKIKVLSLIQPWASLIAIGEKNIETRSWKTNYRGMIYIHASGKTDRMFSENKFVKECLHNIEVPNGKIIAKCKLRDCIEMTEDFIKKIEKDKKEYAFGIYSIGRYAWILENIRPLKKHIIAKGKLGLWSYTLQ
jgi:hypothetical protein